MGILSDSSAVPDYAITGGATAAANTAASIASATGAATLGAQSPMATPANTAQANALYQTHLGRAGDAEGVKYWANQLASGQSLNDVTNNFKTAAKGVYNDYLTNPNNQYSKDTNLNGILSGDLNNQAGIGSSTGTAQSVAKNNLKAPIYNDLYGDATSPTNTPAVPVTTGNTSLTTNTNGTTAGTTNGSYTNLPAYTGAVTPVQQDTTGAAQTANAVTAGYNPTTLGTPTKWDITANQTTQGQMSSLIDPNSPYYQAWKNAGANDAAARGFTGNSTIRDSAIMDSVIRNATPIAQSDAAINAKAAGYNADMPNQFAVANQNANNTAGQFNSREKNQMAQAQITASTARYGTDVSASTQRFVAGLNSDTQKAVATMNNASQATISSAHDANAVFLANNKAAQDSLANLANGMNINDNNDKMDGQAKVSANNNLIHLYNINPINLANTNFVPTPYQVYEPPASNHPSGRGATKYLNGEPVDENGNVIKT